MTDMIERVARVICCGRQNPPFCGYGTDDYSETSCASKDEYCTGTARAAIEAMRDPTDAMDDAGLDSPEADYCDRCMQAGHIRNSGHPTVIWQAMITEALKGD